MTDWGASNYSDDYWSTKITSSYSPESDFYAAMLGDEITSIEIYTFIGEGILAASSVLPDIEEIASEELLSFFDAAEEDATEESSEPDETEGQEDPTDAAV